MCLTEQAPNKIRDFTLQKTTFYLLTFYKSLAIKNGNEHYKDHRCMAIDGWFFRPESARLKWSPWVIAILAAFRLICWEHKLSFSIIPAGIIVIPTPHLDGMGSYLQKILRIFHDILLINADLAGRDFWRLENWKFTPFRFCWCFFTILKVVLSEKVRVALSCKPWPNSGGG